MRGRHPGNGAIVVVAGRVSLAKFLIGRGQDKEIIAVLFDFDVDRFQQSLASLVVVPVAVERQAKSALMGPVASVELDGPGGVRARQGGRC